MAIKLDGSLGIEFPDATNQDTSSYSKAEVDSIMAQLITQSLKDVQGQYAVLKTPKTWISDYKQSYWAAIKDGDSFSFTAGLDGINILKEGIYKVEYSQRVTAASYYGGLALNGDRTSFSERPEGSWTHDHGAGANSFTHSTYIGKLFVGDIITGGANSANSNGLSYGGTAIETYRGEIKITKISDTLISEAVAPTAVYTPEITYSKAEVDTLISNSQAAQKIIPTFLNGWINYSVDYDVCAYWKIGNVVHIGGLIKSGTLNTPAFVLPIGCRPLATHIFNVLSNSTIGRVDIKSNGEVYINSLSSTAWVSLAGISFIAEQ